MYMYVYIFALTKKYWYGKGFFNYSSPSFERPLLKKTTVSQKGWSHIGGTEHRPGCYKVVTS